MKKTNTKKQLKNKIMKTSDLKKMYGCCSKDELRPVFNGLFHDRGNVVATNGHVLVSVKSDYDNDWEGKIIGKDGKEIEGRFPSWERVIPLETKEIDVDAEMLFNAAKNIKIVKFAEMSVIDIQGYLFPSKMIYKVLNVRRNGLRFSIRESEYSTAMKIDGDNFTAVVMGLLDEKIIEENKKNIEENNVPIIYTIDEALNYKKPEQIIFSFNSELNKGFIVDSFEIEGEKFDVVKTNKHVYSVKNGEAQEFIDQMWGETYMEMIERLRLETNDQIEKGGLNENIFDMPSKLELDYFITKDVDGQNIVEKTSGKIDKIYVVDGKQLKIVKSGAYKYNIVFDKFCLGDTYSPEEYIDRIKSTKKIWNLIGDFIDKTYVSRQ